MSRSYRHIKEYEKEILQLKEQGLTKKEIGIKLGFNKDRIHNFFSRYNETQRRVSAGIALKKRGRPPKDYVVREEEKVTAELQLHSDQGFQYTSQAYFNLTKSYNITPSMSRKENPYDNAMAENFFSILKTEYIYRTKLRTYEEARLLIGQYIHFYNNERIQLKTKLTPQEMRSQYVA